MPQSIFKTEIYFGIGHLALIVVKNPEVVSFIFSCLDQATDRKLLFKA